MNRRQALAVLSGVPFVMTPIAEPQEMRRDGNWWQNLVPEFLA